jgi:hypothetical protein
MSLTPLRSPFLNPRAQQQLPANVVRSKEPDPTPAAPVQTRVDIEHLTVADVRELSTATINALIPYNRKVVAQAVIDAGRRRRGELETPMTSLKPIARFILLAGERRRGRELNDEEAGFMADFLESVGAA